MTLTGEPGIGKSHIALALNERLQGNTHITLRYFCSEHYAHSALFPFISQLERAAGFNTAIHLRRSYPSSALYCRNPHAIPNAWPFGQFVGAAQPMITTDCRTSLRKDAKRRPLRHYLPARRVSGEAAGFTYFRRCTLD